MGEMDGTDSKGLGARVAVKCQIARSEKGGPSIRPLQMRNHSTKHGTHGLHMLLMVLLGSESKSLSLHDKSPRSNGSNVAGTVPCRLSACDEARHDDSECRFSMGAWVPISISISI